MRRAGDFAIDLKVLVDSGHGLGFIALIDNWDSEILSASRFDPRQVQVGVLAASKRVLEVKLCVAHYVPCRIEQSPGGDDKLSQPVRGFTGESQHNIADAPAATPKYNARNGKDRRVEGVSDVEAITQSTEVLERDGRMFFALLRLLF